MAGPGYLFGPFSLLEVRVIPDRAASGHPSQPPPGRHAPVGHDTSGRPRKRARHRLPGPGITLAFEGGGATPPLPPPPRLRPRPPLRWAWDRAADPWQGRLRSP